MGNCSRKKQEQKKQKTQVLTEENIAKLLANTGLDRPTIEEWHKNFINDCPDGRLTQAKFAQIFNLFNKTKYENAKKFSKYVYKAFDKDKNGYIDFSEFLLGVTLLSSSDRIVDKLRFIYVIYDLDGDGGIDLKEMIKVIECLYDLRDVPKQEMTGNNSPEFIAREIMKKFDKDGNKSLTQTEFIDGCLEFDQIRLVMMPSQV